MVLYSADGSWRLERAAKEIRLLYGSRQKGAWSLWAQFRTVAELDRWLRDNDDPVDEWVTC